ncbi:cytochrome P450 [Chytriomyces sp. MP71]|nr:cytochrome P450 [Chytriomyces sp. MP71]
MEAVADALGTSSLHLGVTAGVVLFVAVLARSGGKKGRAIPGPRGYPIVGNLFELASFSARGKLHEFMAQMHENYGDTFKLSICGEGIVDHALFVFPSGELWKYHRKAIQPAFGPSHLRHGLQIAGEEVEKLNAYLEAKFETGAGELVVDAHEEFVALFLDIIGRIAFSYEFNSLTSLHEGKDAEGHRMIKDIGLQLQERFSYPPFVWWFIGLSSNTPRIQKAQNYVRNLLSGLIAQKKLESETGGKVDRDKDVLDRLLSVGGDDKKKFTDAEVIGETMGFFFAGHDTTANTTSFILLELSRNIGVQEKLKSEIQSVLEQIGPITVENLAEFKYLDAVVKEAQRLHAVAGIVGRMTSTKVDHDEYVFAPKTVILGDIQGLHTNPKLWTDPNTFNPERWLTPVTPGSFLPFGDGPHNCIGQKLAVIELKRVLIGILARFRVEFVRGQELDFVTSVTYGLKNGLKIRVIPGA